MMTSWLSDWVVWASLGIGLGVSGLVFVLGARFRLGRRRLAAAAGAMREEDLPWHDLLSLLKARYSGGKSPATEDLSSDELMDLLLKDLPASTPADAFWEPAGGRRRNRRRWANPIEVTMISPFHDQPIHGLVINRSTGGMAILTDVSVTEGTVLAVRAVEAPKGISYVDVNVRHSRQASKLWIIGCQYNDEVPWNVKVWFG
jgi:hypothetical protein